MAWFALFVVVLFTPVINAQAPGNVFRVPFHSVNGMILLDATGDGKPAALLLDTGANNSIVSPQAAGLTAVQLRSLQATQAGTSAEGDYIAREVVLRLAERHWLNRRVARHGLGGRQQAYGRSG